MTLSEAAKILIIIHAVLGSIALVSASISMIARKGKKVHKKTGKLFYYTMTGCAVSALAVSVMPGHVSPFLFTIGVFTWYLVWTGNASLRYKYPDVKLTTDKAVAVLMMITGLGMILYPILVLGHVNIVLTVFGSFGIVLALLDLKRFSNTETLRQVRLKMHITKMVGAYIAAFTAFIVVTEAIPGLAGWLLPTVPGVGVIVFWLRKLKVKARGVQVA